MLKKLIYRLLARRHFWRDASFDELSELYVSMMMRSLALGIIGIFVPVFLLKSGYAFPDIIGFFVMFFGTRVLADITGGYMVAKIGPKHTMLVSYGIQILAALLFLTLHMYQWPLFWLAATWGTANSLFFVAFHVDFSKVKHSSHGGKELGYVSVMERVGAALGPITGGVIAMFFGAQYMFLPAVILLLLGLVPLFRTSEPVSINQHLDFRALPIPKIQRDIFSYMAVTIEQTISVIMWPLFLALFVISDNVYLKLGGLVSLGFLVSIAAAYTIGKLVDGKKGKQLLEIGAISNAVLHIFRPFVSTLPVAALFSIINEVVTVSYRIPYHKGMYDAADHLPGHRIA
ncbi:MFS transporter, partial [Candidatus Saccharibacteria bacterium]|nr:MFS transporter [Candidatus Saccharibacteria bacterium]